MGQPSLESIAHGGGLIEQAIAHTLDLAQRSRAKGLNCTVRCSFVEVVGDRVLDLLAPHPAVSNVTIRDHDDDRGPVLLGCEEVC